MRVFILCAFALFVGITARAQSAASLNITLTDVQSVRFGVGESVDEAIGKPQPIVQNGTVQLLSQSTSQIKKIHLKGADYDALYKEFYSGTPLAAMSSPKDKNYKTVGASRQKPSRPQTNLLIYQIDPR